MHEAKRDQERCWMFSRGHWKWLSFVRELIPEQGEKPLVLTQTPVAAAWKSSRRPGGRLSLNGSFIHTFSPLLGMAKGKHLTRPPAIGATLEHPCLLSSFSFCFKTRLGKTPFDIPALYPKYTPHTNLLRWTK